MAGTGVRSPESVYLLDGCGVAMVTDEHIVFEVDCWEVMVVKGRKDERRARGEQREVESV